MPSATAVVVGEFGRERDRAVALFSSVVPVGAVLGPLAGALIVTSSSWRGIFLVNVPVGVVLLVAGAVLIRRSPSGAGVGRVDGRGVALLATVLVALMAAVTEVPVVGAEDAALPVLIGAVALVVAAVPSSPATCATIPTPSSRPACSWGAGWARSTS